MIRFSLLKSKETLVVTIIGTGPGGPARAKTVFFRLRNYLTQLDDYVSKQRLEVCTTIVNVSLVAMPEAGRGKKGNNSPVRLNHPQMHFFFILNHAFLLSMEEVS